MITASFDICRFDRLERICSINSEMLVFNVAHTLGDSFDLQTPLFRYLRAIPKPRRPRKPTRQLPERFFMLTVYVGRGMGLFNDEGRRMN